MTDADRCRTGISRLRVVSEGGDPLVSWDEQAQAFLAEHARREALPRQVCSVCQFEYSVEDEHICKTHEVERPTPISCSNAGHDVVFRSGVQDRCNTCDVDF